MEPTRARPVPFWRHSLRPAPETSLFSLTLCVPARCPARYHREASCSRCGFTLAPKTASASSTSPTFFPFRLTTSTTGMISFLLPISLLRLLRLADEDVLAARAGHRSADQQQVLVGVHLDHLQVLGGHLLVAHVPGKVLVLPDSRRERA